jgi:hypothetical protein
VIPTPALLERSAELQGVSCLSAVFCVAVGRVSSSAVHPGPSPSRTLVEFWNGQAWSVVESPNEENDDELKGVSCVSTRFCVAVGSFDLFGRYTIGPGARYPLIERWDGTKWTVAARPSPEAQQTEALNGVSCVSRRSCVAVGYGDSESWNGTEWSDAPKLTTGGLQGVSCVRANRCVAVGSVFVGGSTTDTLVEAWNGTAWSAVESPNPGTGHATLEGVYCVSGRSCAAVGYEQSPGDVSSDTLVMTSKGGKWSIVPSANTGGGYSSLYGVSCVSNGTCFAVGNGTATPGGPGQTLVENGGI